MVKRGRTKKQMGFSAAVFLSLPAVFKDYLIIAIV